jgi:hypothetical protein
VKNSRYPETIECSAAQCNFLVVDNNVDYLSYEFSLE